MEASHVTRKYRSIRNRLLEDSVMFDSTLNRLEQTIRTQQREIQRLEVNRRALLSVCNFCGTCLFYKENQRRSRQVQGQDAIGVAKKRN